jgi:hypothetical protein
MESGFLPFWYQFSRLLSFAVDTNLMERGIVLEDPERDVSPREVLIVETDDQGGLALSHKL